jgi:hypothetical protein
MSLIEVPLNSYRYHFRRLTWPEEIRLPFSPTEDQRRVVLAHALADISGLEVSAAQAMEILKKLPEPILWRIWVLYRANLPEERYYTAGGLYEAPDQMAYQERIQHDEETTEAVADEATAIVQKRFGESPESPKPRASAARCSRKSQQEGRLVPARDEAIHG